MASTVPGLLRGPRCSVKGHGGGLQGGREQGGTDEDAITYDGPGVHAWSFQEGRLHSRNVGAC